MKLLLAAAATATVALTGHDGRRVLVETGSVELDGTRHVEVMPFAGEASWNL